VSRQPRNLKPEFCYHITVRCNNREFRLTRFECREVLLYAMDTWEAPDPEIQKVAKKFVLANALNPEIAAAQFDQDCSFEQKTINSV
jgi:hypothetical protein